MLHSRGYKLSLLTACLALAGLGVTQARAVTFSGSSGSLAASVDFSYSGSNLVVVLTNTSTADILVPANVLTTVFFTIPGVTTLTTGSAVLTSGSTVLYAPTPATGPGGDVSGEWAYKSGLSGVPLSGGSMGISSSGLGLFGPGDRFNTSQNLQGPASPAGLDYGIASAGDNPLTGNTGVTKNALIQDSVTFTFLNTPVVDLTGITHVVFQYGTDLSEPNFVGTLVTPPTLPDLPPELPTGDDFDVPTTDRVATPEPLSALTGLGSLAALGLSLTRRKPAGPTR